MMQCPNSGQACPHPSLCKNGCIYDKMSKKSDPNFQGMAPPREMMKRDKARRLMKKSKGRNA